MSPDEITGLSVPFAGRWTIERELGRGGSATVYLAHDLKLDRKVAVKVLHADLARTIGAERFLREVRIAARLSHPHIVQVHDSGEFEGHLYYVMPMVEGETLRELLARDGPLPWNRAVRLAVDVAGALDYAHATGLVHRDIKPENILLHGGHAVVSDFGIARVLSVAGTPGTQSVTLTEAGLAVGTPLYMSPEQILGGSVDARSDLYSLGCVLYEMIAGKAPFDAPTMQAVLARHAMGEIAPLIECAPSVPAAVDAIVGALLSRTPDDRPPSAGAARDALLATLDTPTRALPPPRQSALRPRRLLVGALLGGLLIMAGALWRWRQADAPSTQSVAVLPFASESTVSDDQYFADGMTDEIINALVRVPGLVVTSRNAVFALRDKHLDPQSIGARLHASVLVSGSVQRADGMLRVGVQLVKAADGTVMWSDSYRREDKALFAVQEEVARAIAGALRGRLRQPGTALVERGTNNLEAYDEYQRGRYLLNQRARGASVLRDAADHYARAIALDSTFARAWAGLADAYSLLPGFGGGNPWESFTRARTAAQRALALDSTLAEAQTSLGIIMLFYDREWSGARRVLERAIALDSTSAPAHLFLAWALLAVNRMEDAEREIRVAQRLDPSSALINARVGTMLYNRRRYADAERELRATIARDSSNDLARAELARVLLQENRATEAVRALPDAPDLQAGYLGLGLRAYALGRAGRTKDAAAVQAQLEARARERYIPPEAFAFAALGRGDNNTALDWLERAVSEHAFYVIFLSCEPIFAPLHGNPRFDKLVRDAGLRPFVP